ncbi:complement factor H-like isoform X2 [Micropterus salmoides]|uniref:complement factor H-like isoform X2 n=1 Tax=Micropterus salmoides TaxID=27706 RepID=UPI0018EB4283|nr:complement factor H-like isoform X2 [Micropterus salmoides]
MRLFHLLWLFVLWLNLNKSFQQNEVICSNPRDNLVYYWYDNWRQPTKLDETVRYTCRSGYRSTDGATRATCTREGWRPNPLCQEITCSRLEIANAILNDDRQIYKNYEKVNYVCEKGYRGSPNRTCGENGWRGDSQCTALKCKLPSTPLGTRYEPPYRNVFSPGDTIRVICGEKYGISNHRDPSAVTTCDDDGEWTLRPICLEVICSNPRDNLLYYWYDNWRQPTKLDETVRYTCRSGYRSTDGATRATCTREGWRPNPLCQEITCSRLEIANAILNDDRQIYKNYEKVNYVCEKGYRGSPTRTCGENGWTGDSQCTALKCKLPSTPLGTRYEPPYRNVFSPGDTIRVICGEKYGISNHRDPSAVTTCDDDGEWTLRPVCLEVICSNPRDNLVYYWYDNWRQPTKLDETVRYTCRSGYRSTDGATRATCTREGWRPNPLCQEITCSRLEIANAILNDDRQIYKNYEKVNYVCEKGYRGSPTRTCGENGWRGDSQCTDEKKCGEIPVIPNSEVPLQDNDYRDGERFQIKCKEGYHAQDFLTCHNGTWRSNEPLETICAQLVDCGTPPVLADGDLKYTMKSKYSYNETVEYTCQEYYTMEGEPYRTCLNGEWTGHMRCLKPCVLNEDDIRQHNITLKSGDKKYLSHDEMIEFKCARGIPAGAVAMRQRCNGGVILLPTCQ